MHGSAGLHSALAIKRQRRLREQAKQRAVERRRLSSSTNSIDSGEHRPVHKASQAAPADHALATSIGMLHLGVCFLVLGICLIGSGLLPDDVVTWRSGGWWNELLATGLFVVALGVFLIALNRVMSKKEEDDLNEYVQRQLTRSRSGHRLERDVETGCLTTKNHRRFIERQREDKDRGLLDAVSTSSDQHQPPLDIPQIHSPKTVAGGDAAPVVFAYQNGDAHLERILEEEVVLDRGEDDPYKRAAAAAAAEYACLNKSSAFAAGPGVAASDGCASETHELLSNGTHHIRHHHSRI